LIESIRVDELPAYNQKLFSDLMKNHEKRFAERIKGIRRTSTELVTIADKLELSIRNAWGSLDKTTSEQGIRLAQTIRDNAQQLSTQEEKQPNYKNSETFHDNAVEASNKIILAIRKYAPKLHKTLKADIASLNSSLMKFETSINALGISLDESPGRALETLDTEVKLLVEKTHALRQLKLQTQATQESITKESDNEQRTREEESALLSSEAFHQLKYYEETLTSNETEIDQLLQPLVKPLKKLERLLSKDELLPPEHQALAKLIENPMNSIEINTREIRKLLHVLNNYLASGQMEIEDRKRRRAQEVITAIEERELDKLSEAHNTIQHSIKETVDKLELNGLLQKRNDIMQRLLEIKSKTVQLNTLLNEYEKRVNETSKVLSKQKTLIESKINELTGKELTITPYM
jgi:hypothetical protein